MKHKPFLYRRDTKIVKLSFFQIYYRQDFHNLFPLIYFTVEKRRVLNINVKAVYIFIDAHRPTHSNVCVCNFCVLLKNFPCMTFVTSSSNKRRFEVFLVCREYFPYKLSKFCGMPLHLLLVLDDNGRQSACAD